MGRQRMSVHNIRGGRHGGPNRDLPKTPNRGISGGLPSPTESQTLLVSLGGHPHTCHLRPDSNSGSDLRLTDCLLVSPFLFKTTTATATRTARPPTTPMTIPATDPALIPEEGGGLPLLVGPLPPYTAVTYSWPLTARVVHLTLTTWEEGTLSIEARLVHSAPVTPLSTN